MVNMNRLSTEKRAQILGCLVEGNSIRAAVRMTGAAKNTITRSHRSLKERYPRTPTMAAGIADHIWSLEEIAALLD
jgi:hypothetical protein